MRNAKLLDCTLRDGAYLIDKKFGDNTIRGIINGLIQAHVDFIEIGFFQDDGFGAGKTVYKNAADAQRFVPKDKKNSEFTVLADYSRYSVENLDDYTGESIDAVRECFFKQERFDAMNACRTIKQKGYKLFVQPVDILGYSDIELIEFIHIINEIEPYCFSIVDTFGSMYEEDLQRVFSIINNNLISTSKIGFHSHNNMQLSNALTQSFLRMSRGKRKVVVDGTISGMGRGAGNTPTELIAQYMTSKLSYNYDMDALLDVIDSYMDNIRSQCEWGYTTPYFIAGCYSAHVNNVTYLTQKNSIRSKDIRYILNKIGETSRKRYNYGLLEQIYVECFESEIDDSAAMNYLNYCFKGKNVLILIPGNSVSEKANIIEKYISDNDCIVISVNFIHDNIKSDFVYMNNVKRYNYWSNNSEFSKCKKILTSNVIIDNYADQNSTIVSFNKLVKYGWEYPDNSAIMLLRLMDMLSIAKIGIAGFDGYSYKKDGGLNYATKYLELSNVKDNPVELNKEISKMLIDFMNTRVGNADIEFVTSSRFAKYIKLFI